MTTINRASGKTNIFERMRETVPGGALVRMVVGLSFGLQLQTGYNFVEATCEDAQNHLLLASDEEVIARHQMQ